MQRKNLRDGKVVSENYGRITAMALDLIEKKPYIIFIGKEILSVGSMAVIRCLCQNHDISMVYGNGNRLRNITCEGLYLRMS